MVGWGIASTVVSSNAVPRFETPPFTVAPYCAPRTAIKFAFGSASRVGPLGGAVVAPFCEHGFRLSVRRAAVGRSIGMFYG
jgi:hypothetical protein